MKFKMFKNLSKLISPVLLFAPSVSIAAAAVIFSTAPPTERIDPLAFLVKITQFTMAIVFAISIIVVLYGGFLYVTSGGDPEKANKARTLLIYGVIGIGVAAVAYGISGYVIEFFRTGTGATQ